MENMEQNQSLNFEGLKHYDEKIKDYIKNNIPEEAAHAAVAEKLETSRLIDGLSFNGSTNVSRYGTCSSSAADSAKTVTISNFSLVEGAQIIVRFSQANTASSPTLNVNGTGAKAIKLNNATLPSSQYWSAYSVLTFVYATSAWNLIGAVKDNNTTYSVMTGASSTANGTAGLVPIPYSTQRNYFLRGDGKWAEIPTGTTVNFPITVEQGGTNATDAATARANLGITPSNIGALSLDGGTVSGTISAKKIIITDTNGGTSHLGFSRENLNYVTMPATGSLGFIANDTINEANCTIRINTDTFSLGTNKIANLSAGTLKIKTLNLPTSSGGSTLGAGSSGQVLKTNGTTVYWGNDNNTTYSNASTEAAGLMSAADKIKLNGIAEGANNYTYTLTKAKVENVLTGKITSHTHDYLPLSGGTLTGSFILSNSATTPKISFTPSNFSNVMGTLQYNAEAEKTTSRYQFLQYSRSSTDYSRIGYYEAYSLPSVDANRTEHGYYNILTSKDKITLAQGGTGANLSNIPDYAIVRNSGTDAGLYYTATANGAFYATAENGMPKFGTLPIAQGGTGATTKADAFNNIVAQGGTFTGGVTFKGHPMLSNSSYYGSLWFNPTMITSDTNASIARIYAYAANGSDTAITRSQMIIRQYSYTSGTTNILSSYYDDFKLPLTAADKTKTNSYEILTSKNPVTVEQGGTNATTPAAARASLGITPTNIGAAPTEHEHLSEDITDLAQISKTASYDDLEGAPVISLNNLITWGAGEVAAYRVGNILIQGAVSATFSVSANAITEQTITFPTPYKAGTKPLINIGPYYNSNNAGAHSAYNPTILSWDNTGVKVGISMGSKSGTPRFTWLAIGEIETNTSDEGDSGTVVPTSFTSGASHSQTTYVGREVMEIPVSNLSGTINSVDLKYNLRVGTNANFTYTIYLFKTLTVNSSYWNDRGDYWYNYPLASTPTSQYFKASYASNILATLSVTEKVTTGAKTKTITTFTDYGKDAANWNGTVYLGIVCSDTDLYWGNSTTSTLSIS